MRFAAYSSAHSATHLIAACAIALCATSSFAAGEHAGSHAHHGAKAPSAIGQPGVAAKVSRTVLVEMNDSMRFVPAQISVQQGETVRLVVKNTGQLVHEMVLGTQQDLKAHYAAMLKNPDMQHADPQMLSVQPGKTGELVWSFTQAGTVDFACLQPGHLTAGMQGAVTVSTAQ